MNKALVIGGVVLIVVVALVLVLYFLVFKKKKSSDGGPGAAPVATTLDIKSIANSVSIGVIPDIDGLNGNSEGTVSGYMMTEYYTCGSEVADTKDMNKYIWLRVRWKNPAILTDRVSKWELTLTAIPSITGSNPVPEPYIITVYNSLAKGLDMITNNPDDKLRSETNLDDDSTGKRIVKQVRFSTYTDSSYTTTNKKDILIGPTLKSDDTYEVQAPVEDLFENNKFVSIDICMGKATKNTNMYKGTFKFGLKYTQLYADIITPQPIFLTNPVDLPLSAFSCSTSDLGQLTTINYSMAVVQQELGYSGSVVQQRRYPTLFSFFRVDTNNDTRTIPMSSIYTVSKNGRELICRTSAIVGPFVNNTQFYLVQTPESKDTFKIFMLDTDAAETPLYIHLADKINKITNRTDERTLILDPAENDALVISFSTARFSHSRSNVCISCNINRYKQDPTETLIGDVFVFAALSDMSLILCHPIRAGGTRFANLLRSYDYNSITSEDITRLGGYWMANGNRLSMSSNFVILDSSLSSPTTWAWEFIDSTKSEAGIKCTTGSVIKYLRYTDIIGTNDATFELTTTPNASDPKMKIIKISGGAGTFERDAYIVTTLQSVNDDTPYKMFRFGKNTPAIRDYVNNRFDSNPSEFTTIVPVGYFTIIGNPTQYKYATQCSTNKYILHNNTPMVVNAHTKTYENFIEPASGSSYTAQTGSVSTTLTTMPACPGVSATSYIYYGSGRSGNTFNKTIDPRLVGIRNILSSKVVLEATNTPSGDDNIEDYLITAGVPFS